MEVGYMLGKWTKYWILGKIYVKYQYLKFYIMNSSMWWKVFKLRNRNNKSLKTNKDLLFYR